MEIEGLGEIIKIWGRFGDIVRTLEGLTARLVLPAEEAVVRIKKIPGRGEEKTFTLANFEYVKGECPIITKASRLLGHNYVWQTKGSLPYFYFLTDSRDEYGSSLRDIEQEANRDIKDRYAMKLPSRESFFISPTENSEVLDFLFEDLAEEYFRVCGSKPIKVRLIDPRIVDSYDGTLLNPLSISYFEEVDDDGEYNRTVAIGGDLKSFNETRFARAIYYHRRPDREIQEALRLYDAWNR